MEEAHENIVHSPFLLTSPISLLWNDFMPRLGRVLPARCVGLFSHEFSATPGGEVLEAFSIESALLAKYARIAGGNPWFAAMRNAHEGDAIIGSDLVPSWELVRTAFYRNWLRPLNVRHALIGMVYRESSQAVFLIALRAPTESPFGSRDTYIFDLILPPLGRILRLAAELGMLRNLTEDMTDVLRMCPGAVIIVTDDLRPVFLNPPAQSLLARSDGLALIHDTLTTTSSRQAAQLRQLIAERGNHDEEVQTAAPGAFARRILIDRPSGAPPLVLHVERLPHPVSDGTGRIRSAAVVFAGNPNGDGTLDLLRRHYGMTPTEARLAGLIANGHTLSHAAANMNISHNTARTHMKRVYAKTDTRRQADLVRLLGSDSVAMRGSRH